MNPVTTAKITPIGNSKGIRIPKRLLDQYKFTTTVDVEETAEGLLIKPQIKEENHKELSWQETFEEMAEANEDWSEWDCVIADGLDEIPWKD